MKKSTDKQQELLDNLDFTITQAPLELEYIASQQKIFEAIARMLKCSISQGLAVEVIYSFAEEMRNQSDIVEATNFALNEWDC